MGSDGSAVSEANEDAAGGSRPYCGLKKSGVKYYPHFPAPAPAPFPLYSVPFYFLEMPTFRPQFLLAPNFAKRSPFTAPRTASYSKFLGTNIIPVGMPRKGYTQSAASKKIWASGRIGPKVYNRKKGYTNRRTGGFSGMEIKFFDTTVSNLAFSTSWLGMPPSSPASILCLNAVPVGSGESEHLGRTFNMRSIFLRMQVTLPTLEQLTLPTADVVYRIIVLMDTQTNGAAVTPTAVVDVPTNGTQAYRNLQNSTRFNILWDSGRRVMRPSGLVNEGAINSFAHSTTDHILNFNHKFKEPIKVRTDGTTAVIGSLTDYSIQVIAIASSTNLDLAYTSRLRYSEI